MHPVTENILKKYQENIKAKIDYDWWVSNSAKFPAALSQLNLIPLIDAVINGEVDFIDDCTAKTRRGYLNKVKATLNPDKVNWSLLATGSMDGLTDTLTSNGLNYTSNINEQCGEIFLALQFNVKAQDKILTVDDDYLQVELVYSDDETGELYGIEVELNKGDVQRFAPNLADGALCKTIDKAFGRGAMLEDGPKQDPRDIRNDEVFDSFINKSPIEAVLSFEGKSVLNSILIHGFPIGESSEIKEAIVKGIKANFMLDSKPALFNTSNLPDYLFRVGEYTSTQGPELSKHFTHYLALCDQLKQDDVIIRFTNWYFSLQFSAVAFDNYVLPSIPEEQLQNVDWKSLHESINHSPGIIATQLKYKALSYLDDETSIQIPEHSL